MKDQRQEVHGNSNCYELLSAGYFMNVTSFNPCGNPMRECINFLGPL